MATGALAALVIGWLMDSTSLEICTAVTIVLGMAHLLVLSSAGSSLSWMIASFMIYVLFRQFLFPVFIASLTANLGFKYFGLLSGIGFAVSGIVQLLMADLVMLVQGTCHRHLGSADYMTIQCSEGTWDALHFVQISLLGALLCVPYLDYRSKIRYDARVQKSILMKISRPPSQTSVATSSESR
jgi:hypothetical protein